MHRAVIIPTGVLALLLMVATACGPTATGAAETLPPIRTTTSTSTSTTTPDSRRRFYEVKRGDNLAVIARSFDVPPSEIVRINHLIDGGQRVHLGRQARYLAHGTTFSFRKSTKRIDMATALERRSGLH